MLEDEFLLGGVSRVNHCWRRFFSGKVLEMRRRLFMNLMSSKDILHLKATVPCCERCIFFDWGTRITIVDVLVRCHVCLPEPPSVRL